MRIELAAFFVICVIVLISAFWLQKNQNKRSTGVLQQQSSVSIPDKSMASIRVGDTVLAVEVVRSPASLARGLGDRDAVGSDGMLFIFDKKQQATFWMKNMRFSIDIVWISDQVVVGITDHVLPPLKPVADSDLPVYQSPHLVDWVLELPAGRAAEIGITTDSRVTFLD